MHRIYSALHSSRRRFTYSTGILVNLKGFLLNYACQILASNYKVKVMSLNFRLKHGSHSLRVDGRSDIKPTNSEIHNLQISKLS